MADNQNTNARRQAETDPKDDDPFAELARIVGFEDDKDKVVPDELAAGDLDEPAAVEATAPVADELDAGLDLEAELLRELEIDVGEDAGSPVEQSALPESTFGLPSEPEPGEGTAPPPGPNFFDFPDETPSEPVVESPFSEAAIEPEVGAAAAKPENVPGGAWPAATTLPIGSPATSLEAELQAAFSALEESGSGPAADIAEPPVSLADDPVLPPEPIKESEELASAYRSFEENVEAAIPREELSQAAPPEVTMPEATMPDVTPVDDPSADVNDLLLAEMIDVEAEAAEAAAPSRDVPFDPANIADSDDIPETMADLDVPRFEPDDIAPVPPAEAEFGLPLEEELEALASGTSGIGPGQDQAEPYRYSTGPEESLESELDGIGDDLDIAAEPDDGVSLDSDDLDEFAGDTFEDYDDAPLDDDAEFAIDDDDLSVPEYDAIVESGSDHSNRRGLIAAAAVVGIVVIGGAGFYLWNGSLGGNAGADGPRVIAADSEPVKIKPDSPGGKTVPNQDLAVYDKVAGTESGTPSQQNLVNTTEEPVDVVQRTLDPDTLPLEGRADGAETAVKSEDRLAASEETDAGNGDAASNANGISPRKVRTLVVKPDGTIVAREAPVATAQTGESGAATTVVTQPAASASGESGTTTGNATRTVALAPANNTAAASNTTPATTTADTTQVASTTSSQNSASTAAAGGDAALPPIEADLRNTGAVPVPGSKPGGQSAGTQAVASADTGASQPAAAAPVPSSRPAEQPVTIVEAVNENGNLAGGASTSNPGGYVMQISSQPSEAGAQESYRNLSRRYASIIGNRGVSIQRANIANRGVFYRVRIPAGSKAEATALCNQYKAAGGSCFVAR